MKIISKYKDYYDGCNYSHDASTGVYERKQVDIPVEWIGIGSSVISNIPNYSYEAVSGIIGFCGMLYPFIRYKHYIPSSIPYEDNGTDFAYSLDEFEIFRSKVKNINRHNKAKCRYYGADIMMGWDKVDNAKLWFNQQFTTLQSNKWTKSHNHHYINPMDLFLEHKVPYFALEAYSKHPLDVKKSQYKLTLNPCLKDYKFYRMFDAYSTWQEIEMYLSNVLAKPDDPYIEPISDELKAQNHGYDAFSFRKPKGKKRRGKKLK